MPPYPTPVQQEQALDDHYRSSAGSAADLALVVRPSPLSRTAFGPTSRRPAKIRWHRPAAAAASTEFDQLIKDSHDEAFNEVGLDVGTPVLRIAYTTPVRSCRHAGASAGSCRIAGTGRRGTDEEERGSVHGPRVPCRRSGIPRIRLAHRAVIVNVARHVLVTGGKMACGSLFAAVSADYRRVWQL